MHKTNKTREGLGVGEGHKDRCKEDGSWVPEMVTILVRFLLDFATRQL